jgi:anthranilate phosphoribosyltransferase
VRNAAIFRHLLDDPANPDLSGLADAITLNAAAALVAYSAAGGLIRPPGSTAGPATLPDPQSPLMARLEAALPLTRAALLSGAARDLLDRWISTSVELSGKA